MKQGYLLLENGLHFEGKLSDEQTGIFPGEVVFNTGMCGYPESLTDPSYLGQILVFTYPLIGNYGVTLPSAWESSKIQVAGAVFNEACQNWSHHAGLRSLAEWLKSEQIPYLTGVDTRALTKLLRTKGTMSGAISHLENASWEKIHDLRPLACERRVYGQGPLRVIAVDCGMKESMLRLLTQFPIEVVRVPYNYDFTDEEFDGVFLSNGPGDPIEYQMTIQTVKKALLREKPIFGVCLGSQMLALASGAQTYRLPFGHRGQNQPCMDLETQRCYITSQNHGYAVAESSLSEEWKVTFRNLNDHSVEGIAHREHPFFAVQFHPEASPGPTDARWLFERFYSCLNAKKKKF